MRRKAKTEIKKIKEKTKIKKKKTRKKKTKKTKEGKEEEEAEEKEKKKQEEEEEQEDGEGEEKQKTEKETSSEKEQEGKTEEEPEKDKDKRRELSAIPASPSVRRMAREMGVDLTKVEGSGPGNRISADDIKKHAEKPEAAETKAAPQIQLPDFSKWGPTSEESMTRIRKITAQNVTGSWQNIPHVTQFDEADMTSLENFRKQNQEKIEKEGGKLTVTALLLKIAAYALQKFPQFNASLDYQNEKIIYKHYFNIGIAVDTPQGLLVPVVRDVNKKSLKELAAELTELAEKARNKKLSLDELQGGNFTISNLGGIGGTAFTPIVLPPQVAILGVSRAQYKPVFTGDDFEKKLVIPLSLSYDHRIIDGADGARFLRWICDVIEDPFAMLF